MQKEISKQNFKKESKQYEEEKTNMSKKIIALVLAIALVFSTVTVAFAEDIISADAKALAAIGMLLGNGNGVTVEYTKSTPSRLQSAILFLRLKGLEGEAKVFNGEDNFNDVKEYEWTEGKNIMSYLKAHPELGWIGNEEGNFMPGKKINEQSYYKVLLEALGYKQNTNTVVGDFDYDEVFEFAKSIGLAPENLESFTIDNLAKATVAALKNEMKGGKLLIEVLIENGKIDKAVAINNGLYEEPVLAKVKSAKAIGNTVVEVTFEDEVSASYAEKAANYSIAGLTVKSAELVAEDVVRLETAAMSAGKLYTLKVNEVAVKFTGIAKVSGAPSIEKVVSTDVEEVVITFNKALDFATATDASNYSIADVKIEKAELDGKVVTLTTNGLAARKQYSVKVVDVKSIDGVALKSQIKSFYTRPDTTAPSVSEVKAETNKRVVVKFSEKVNKETAENIENYTIKTGTTALEVIKAELVGDDENKVELTIESQKVSARYEITIANIADQTKSGNVMSKAVTKYFYGMREDTTAPVLSRADLVVLSRNHIQAAFTDASRLDEATVLDANNYTVTKNDLSKADIAVEKVEKVSNEGSKYVVILTVEDLSINSSYTVKAENIADEYGNVLEKNNSLSVSVSRDSLAASTVSGKKPVDGNKLEITFTKPLNEATAEDIANYTINGNIGTPVKATYEDKVVTLETVNMTAGKTYEIKIKGVEDLAGNVLDLKFEFVAAAGDKDETAPKLVSIYSVNKNVVAAEFDEAVTFEKGTKLVLAKANKAEIEFTANATSEGGRVVEFSNLSEDLNEDAYTVVNAKSFLVSAGVVGIKDKAVTPNKLVVSEITEEYTVYGNDIEMEAPEVLSVYQKDGKTFEMIMSKEVIAKLAETKDFKVAVDEDDKTLVTFTIKGDKIVDGHEYKTNIALVLKDFHGVDAKNVDADKNETILYGEYKDEENPFIVNVIAKDRYTVEIEFSEAMGVAGSYEIKNTDETATYKIISNTVDNFKVGDKKVVLKLSLPLESRYDYQLKVTSQAKDLVNNAVEDQVGDEFFFTGTDLAPVALD